MPDGSAYGGGAAHVADADVVDANHIQCTHHLLATDEHCCNLVRGSFYMEVWGKVSEKVVLGGVLSHQGCLSSGVSLCHGALQEDFNFMSSNSCV